MTNTEIIRKAESIIHDPERPEVLPLEDIGTISAALGIARILARRTAEDDNAREERRLVELPCKVGGFVFVSPNNGKSFHKAKLYGKNENGSHLVQLRDDLLTEDEKHLVSAPMSKIFYDWYFAVYTRQEAEAALSEGSGEDDPRVTDN